VLIHGRDLVIRDSDTGVLKHERDVDMFGLMARVFSHLCPS